MGGGGAGMDTGFGSSARSALLIAVGRGLRGELPLGGGCGGDTEGGAGGEGGGVGPTDSEGP